MLRTFWDDLRYAARRVRKQPLVAVTVTGSTMLAVGATTAVVSVVNGLLLRPLPLPEPDRVVRIAGVDSRSPGAGWAGVSYPNARDLAARSRTLDIAVYNQNWSGTLQAGGDPLPVDYAVVSNALAAVLGVRPMLGRWFRVEEHIPGGDNVAVLTHDGWQRLLGGDSTLVGRSILVDGTSRTVVGILPPLGIDFPKTGLLFWAPLALSETGPSAWRSARDTPWLAAVGRIRPTATFERAGAELALLGVELAREHPSANETKSYRIERLQDAIIGPVRPMLLLLAGAVVGVLLIACGNVAMLLLATAERRRGEFAVRAALGGSGGRVTRQVLVEAFALTAAGGAIGIAIAPAIVNLFLGLYPEPLLTRAQIALDLRVLASGAAMIVLAAILAGLPPALEARRLEIGDRLREVGRAAGRRERRRNGSLIVGQVALSVVLLFTAGVLLRSFWKLTHLELGFDPHNVLTFWLTPAPARAGGGETLFSELITAVRALPGVREVATSYDIPTGVRSFGTWVSREGESDLGTRAPTAGVQMVGPRYFAALGIPLLGGRDIEPGDRPAARYVAVVNRSFADRMFPGQSPLGRRVVVWDTAHTIVGVVGDARRARPLWDRPEPEMYFSIEQRRQGWRYVVVRLEDGHPAEALIPAVEAVVHRLDPSLPLAELAMLEDRLTEVSAPQRFRTTLVGALAALALVLSSVGIYGVVAYSVSRRTREIGVRIALGESRRTTQLRVVAQALVPAVVGLSLGLGAALLAARWLDRFVTGVAPRDPVTLAAVGILFVGVAILAAYWPARRASRIDPTEALRTE